MLRALHLLLPRILIGVSFFLFGFFVIGNALDLTARDIIGGLVAGAVGGVTMLLVILDKAFELRPEIRARLDAPTNPE